ncbi:MAG: AAA family ATPase [Flavobacteriales bacterium]
MPFTEKLLERLGHAPTPGQRKAIEALERLLSTERPRSTLVLKGYAGTGKTTLVGALVKVLRDQGHPAVLLAPTGRAANVLSGYAQAPASTIHRRVYKVEGEEDGMGSMRVAPNKDSDTLFVVDEASMIGTTGGGGDRLFHDRNLLQDLADHVFSGRGNRLLLIGDPAQLPPVGDERSPALDVKLLREVHDLNAGSVELTEVVRQAEASGILVNATALRQTLLQYAAGEEKVVPVFVLKKDEEASSVKAQASRFNGAELFPDVTRIEGHDLQDALESGYGKHGQDSVCLICRSNKRAYLFNQQVRSRIMGYEEELCAGDRLMVVKNNYYWAGQEGKPELIANGEPVEVLSVKGIEEKHGFRFARLDVAWQTRNAAGGSERRELEVMALLDVLTADTPALPGPRMRELTQAVLAGVVAKSKRERFKKLQDDPYVNALQVKYAYAVTCHKAQGGQWPTVFVDQGYVTEEMIDAEYVRWLYTAVTRASEQLYLLNFHPRFFGEE